MTNPLFSVVTISLNQAEFLSRAIESVIGQEGVRIQYIVCDPGSTDGSRAIIDSYGKAIAERVYEADGGPADGLNRGFARARGDIYCYLNSDDMFLPGAFTRVAKQFRKRPEADVLTGHTLITDRQDRVLRRAWSQAYLRRTVAYGVVGQLQPSTFIRANSFRKTPGFNPANASSWDGELLLELYLSGARIEVIDDFLSAYRLHATSLTNTGASGEDAERFLRERFVRLMGRERRRYDQAWDIAYRWWKRLRHPRTIIEQHRYGRIYMRGAE